MAKRDPEFDWVSFKIMLWMASGGRCAFCGKGLGNDGDIHHRKLRSQGGADDEANCVLIHRACHHWAHMNPDAAYSLGWLVRGAFDPADVEVVVTEPWRSASG